MKVGYSNNTMIYHGSMEFKVDSSHPLHDIVYRAWMQCFKKWADDVKPYRARIVQNSEFIATINVADIETKFILIECGESWNEDHQCMEFFTKWMQISND